MRRRQARRASLGDSVRSKTEMNQINEVPYKVLCHNICVLILAISVLNIEPSFRAKSNQENHSRDLEVVSIPFAMGKAP